MSTRYEVSEKGKDALGPLAAMHRAAGLSSLEEQYLRIVLSRGSISTEESQFLKGAKTPTGLFPDWVINSLLRQGYLRIQTSLEPGKFTPIQFSAMQAGIKEFQPPESQTIGAKMVTALVTKTINDITYDQMNRIIRALKYLSSDARNAPKHVADILSKELGPEKALSYVEKALAAGTIKAQEYNELRMFLILPMPRERIPYPEAGMASMELLKTQKKIQQDFGKLGQVGKQALEKPFQVVNKDIERLKRAWGK